MERRAVILLLLTTLISFQNLTAQTTIFNYQGKLTDGGNPANGAFQMRFKLFDSLGGAGQVGSTLTDLPVTVSQGIFSVKLDFGASPLSGANRWLEIAVRRNSGESYVTLSPREQIASSPYAVQTLNAQMLGGVPASEYVTTSSVGSSFVRNGTTLQSGNFNISGNGFIGGLLGVGTTTPSFPLDVIGPIRSLRNTSTDFVAQTTGPTNAWARFTMITPSQSWSIGSSQNFNGNQFYVHDLTSGQNRITVQPAGGAISFPLGNVGIGTSNPGSKFEIAGTGFGSQQRITDTVSGNSLVLQSGAGTDMKVTGYNYNTAQPVPLTLSVDGANLGIGGNIAQPRDKGGAAKGLIYVNGDGSMIRCFNGVTGASTVGCGISSSHSVNNPGTYFIEYPFRVDDRFWVGSVVDPSGGYVFTVSLSTLHQTILRVEVRSMGNVLTDRPFMLAVD